MRYPAQVDAAQIAQAVLTDSDEKNPARNSGQNLARVAKNSLANLSRMGTSWLLALFLPPLLVRVLDKPAYATWVLILQVGAYVALVDSTIQTVIGRFVARAEGLDDKGYMGRILSSAAVCMLAVSSVAALLLLLGAWQMQHLFKGIPPGFILDARSALLIVGMSLIFTLPFSTLAGTFVGLQKNEVNALAGSLGKIIGACGAAWAAYHHQSLGTMATWIAAGNVLQATTYSWAWTRLSMQHVLRWANVSKHAVNEFVIFCSSIFAAQIGMILITGLDLPIVAAFDFHSAAYYAVAATASNMLIVPQGAIVATLVPIASGISATPSPARLGAAVIKTTRYATAVLCVLALPLLVGMYPLLTLWVGADYASHATTPAIILVVAQFIRLTFMPYAVIGFAAGQQQRMLVSPLGEGIANLACSLTGAYRFGAIGVAWGTLIGACVGIFLHLVNSIPRTDSMTFSRRVLALSGIFRPISCCVLPAAIVLLLLGHAPQPAARFALIAAGELFAILTLWKVNFSADERNDLCALLKLRRSGA